MAKPPIPESPTLPAEEALEDSFYEVPSELQEGAAPPPPPRAQEPDPDDEPPEVEETEVATRPRARFPAAIASAAALAVLCIVGGLVAYRCHGQRKLVREGVAQAEELMVRDTAEGYRKAANLLAPHAKLDPLEAGSARAFALAMLACDYRDAEAEAEANRLLVIPGRADPVPHLASLAFRALALGRGALADAALERSGPQGNAPGERPALPWDKALNARVALSAGTYESALEDATAAGSVPGFVAGLAVQGDAFRRARRDYRTALSAYEAALAVSPAHPRSAFGLAKLALAGQAPEAEARAALGRLLDGGDATPRRERARAILHLAALRIRSGDPVDAIRQDLGAGFEPKELDWLMGAARAEAANRGPYKAVAGAPEPLQSSTDDDLEDKNLRPLAAEPPPPPPPPPAPEPAVEKRAPAAHAPVKASAKNAKASKGKAPKAAAKAGKPAKPAAKAAAAKKKAQPARAPAKKKPARKASR